MSSVVEARAKVQRSVEEVLRLADSGTPRRMAEVETAIWVALLALGRALISLFLVRQAGRPRSVTYEHDGEAYELVGVEPATVGCRFGKVDYARPVGRRVGAPRAARDLPLDRELGLPGGFTVLVVSTIAKLCAHLAFGAARRLHDELFGWTPSSRAILRMVDAAGAEARPFLDEAPPPEGDGDVLVIQGDGKGAPAISSAEYARRTKPHGSKRANRRHGRRRKRQDNPRPRRSPGKKSKNAKMAAVGVMYTLKRDADGKYDGPINKRVYGTFTTYRDLFVWLLAEAKKRGYGTSKFTKVLFIADGAQVLWDLQQEFFPDADICLDWFHVVEKLWDAGKAVCRGTRTKRKELEAWVAHQKKRLRNGQIAEVLAELSARFDATSRTGPGNKYRRDVLASVHQHLFVNQNKLEYARLRRDDLDIGSGAVEGAVRHLVGARLDASGMRWGKRRAESVLVLRCILINGMWADFDRHLARDGACRLEPQPVRAVTHDAKKKAA